MFKSAWVFKELTFCIFIILFSCYCTDYTYKQARFYGGGGANRALAPKSAISPTKDLRGFGGGG